MLASPLCSCGQRVTGADQTPEYFAERAIHYGLVHNDHASARELTRVAYSVARIAGHQAFQDEPILRVNFSATFPSEVRL